MNSFDLVVLIIGVALVFDYINGFHDAANSIATVVSTQVLTPGVAVVWAAVFNFLAAYLLGTMRRAFAITSEYLGTRTQFDKPIGSFQALQHRMVDLYVQIELTGASVLAAARALEGGDERIAVLAVSRAKARAADAAMLVGRQGVQLHGGIGYTDEADIGLYLRKAMTLANLYGGSAAHRARFAAATNLGDVQ